MKIKLLNGLTELCTLDGGPVPAGVSPQAAALKILNYWRVGDWLWIDDDTRAIRYDSITAIEIVPESGEQEIEES